MGSSPLLLVAERALSSVSTDDPSQGIVLFTLVRPKGGPPRPVGMTGRGDGDGGEAGVEVLRVGRGGVRVELHDAVLSVSVIGCG